MSCAHQRNSLRSGSEYQTGVAALVSRRASLSIVSFTVCTPFLSIRTNMESVVSYSHSYSSSHHRRVDSLSLSVLSITNSSHSLYLFFSLLSVSAIKLTCFFSEHGLQISCTYGHGLSCMCKYVNFTVSHDLL